MVALPGNYDALRLATPGEPTARRKRTSTFDFIRDAEISTLDNDCADFAFDADDEGGVWITAMTLDGEVYTASEAEGLIGGAEFDRITAAAQHWWLADGWTEAERDAADEYGDYRYNLARDH